MPRKSAIPPSRGTGNPIQPPPARCVDHPEQPCHPAHRGRQQHNNHERNDRPPDNRQVVTKNLDDTVLRGR